MSIWRKIFGLPLDPKVPEPNLGLLHTMDDEDELSRHKIISAYYNTYVGDGHKWLTIRIAAEEAHLQSGEPDTEAWIELNMLIDGMAEPLLFQGAALKIPAYSEELGNLTNMYYYTHSNFEDATVEIEGASSEGFVTRISGKKDYDPVVARCRLILDNNLKRSFN